MSRYIVTLKDSAKGIVRNWLRMFINPPVRSVRWVGEADSEDAAIERAQEAWFHEFKADPPNDLRVSCEAIASVCPNCKGKQWIANDDGEQSPCPICVGTQVSTVTQTWRGTVIKTTMSDGAAVRLRCGDRGYNTLRRDAP